MHQGSRETKSFFRSRPSSRESNNGTTRDVGLSKRLVLADATFSGATLSGTGNFAVFKIGDLIEIDGTQGGHNNGERPARSPATGPSTPRVQLRTWRSGRNEPDRQSRGRLPRDSHVRRRRCRH